MSDPATAGPAEPFRLVVMCTANQCRSPMAEALARDLLARRGVAAEVTSCGILDAGHPAAEEAVRAVRSLGLDLSSHVSRRLDADAVGRADLVLTMERRHLVEVAGVDMALVHRSFTLPELARLAAALGPRPPGSDPAAWIRAADAMRDPTRVLGMGGEDDVKDPMGGSRRAFRKSAAQLQELLGQVFDRLFPDARPGVAGS